ncbi:Hydroxymethylpyrimidine/phosphomethylpyrimidine kinase [Rhynchospora pubera]|uniref:Hydroxymethylpyrimidine/phosphomethylpyrimidine kinase n=1 Tax=Rhynchospora pubera TaxID=906938 RepID=A0AAV8FP47_9POAL|nr:Hydroxymethylpyrimidine/phosphomethylpyrimidine kinase [Rhynchospora pubera]KAJ4795290.1 Hydroxymethylpyrimidine/phosphomethylpyrimidine kinase [Rhynchospora pubera]
MASSSSLILQPLVLPSTTPRIAFSRLVFLPRSLSPRLRAVSLSTIAMAERTKLPHVLTVAGSDSGGGAGIQADIKACGAMGVYCSSVITAVTAQNTVGVQGVHPVPEAFIEEQLNSVLSDMEVDVVKTGMLPSPGVIKVLCDSLKRFPVKALVVDPVMVSTSGDTLSAPSTLSGYRDDLFGMADIVTPNLKEASALLGGMQLQTVSDMSLAAKSIHKFGPKNVLVKGGDLSGSSDAVDVFFDGETCYELHGSRVQTRNTHGTGCTLASCIAAELSKGSPMLEAVKAAKAFVENALHYSKSIELGSGPQGPFDHLFRLKSPPYNVAPGLKFQPDDLFLYAVTDSGMNSKWGRSMTDAVEAVIKGGATIVQLREKQMETREFIETATACMEICRLHKIPLLINDRVDVALACNADGVHVGQSDMQARTVRALLGPGKIIGVSCKTIAQAEQAWMDGADYIGCGGVFPTSTKKDNTTIGLEGLKEVCLASKLPVVAIGGIGIGNANLVLGTGVKNLKGVAVVSALFDRESVEGETKELRSVLERMLSSVSEGTVVL